MKWKYPKLLETKFTCQHCNEKDKILHIHHNGEKMCDIIFAVAKKHNFEKVLSEPRINHKKFENVRKILVEEIVEYHIENNVSGIVLCEECHSIEHGRPIISKSSKKYKR